LARVYPRTRRAWRAWLAKHHAVSTGIWLIYDKLSTGRRRLGYAEAVEEALCFGWVDSRPNRLDEERYMQLFSPRKPGSAWSAINKQRVERLVAAGLMTPAGLAKIEAAKADGSWSALDEVEALAVPADLARALRANPKAAEYFESFSRSSRKIILTWIATAKRPETRAARVTETVALASRGLKANHYRQ
jgi:uncharacterized protein YdeI (YjbR/CyaY-like superfamily)